MVAWLLETRVVLGRSSARATSLDGKRATERPPQSARLASLRALVSKTLDGTPRDLVSPTTGKSRRDGAKRTRSVAAVRATEPPHICDVGLCPVASIVISPRANRVVAVPGRRTSHRAEQNADPVVLAWI